MDDTKIQLPGLPMRPLHAILVSMLVASTMGGCGGGPRFQAPFTVANPTERHPIRVHQGESTLDLAVYRGSDGLTPSQKAELVRFIAEYKRHEGDRFLIKPPSGGPNETAAMRAFDDIRKSLRAAGIHSNTVSVEPYFYNGNPAAPIHLTYLSLVAQAPDCPDWSENVAQDPQNMPSPNMGCATQRNLAAMVDNPRDLIEPRGETPRPSERRDVVWGKYKAGDVTGAVWGAEEKPLSEHATPSDVGQSGGGQ